jgi:hypothetical protein
LLALRPTKVAAIALANKIARMVWVRMAKGERYKEHARICPSPIVANEPNGRTPEEFAAQKRAADVDAMIKVADIKPD